LKPSGLFRERIACWDSLRFLSAYRASCRLLSETIISLCG
jgi:hypothetical protein